MKKLPFKTYWLLWMFISGSMVFPNFLWAAACSNYFGNGMQTHAATGNINLGFRTQITGGSATLRTKTLTDNSTLAACSGLSCVATGVPGPASTPTFQTGSGANGAVTVGFQQNQSITSGDYGIVNVGQEGVLQFNTNDGLYLTRAMTTGYRSELRLRAGDYWINGDLNLGQETVLRRLAGGTSTRIFVRGNVSLGYLVSTSGFTSNQLLIYATGNITSNQFINVSAFLYAGGNVTLDYKAVVNGAVTGANIITTAGEVTVNYQGNLLSSANFAPLCSGTAVAPVILGSWQMDEKFWNGTAGEVVDSSGSGNHGRARIAAGSTSVPTTSSGSPAYTSGNQNTCHYGTFDQTTAPVRTHSYVELTGFPTLPEGFTFAAWIRSTNPSAQHQRILVRDDAQTGWGLSLADGTGLPKLRFFARSITNNGAVTGQGSNPVCSVFCIDTTAIIGSNLWYYVASTIDTSAKTVTLYVYNQAGVLQAKTSGAYAGTWSDGTGLAAIGGETSASTEGQQSSYHFLGNIDEVKIYSGALPQASIEALLPTVRTCAGPDHYELELASTSVACEGAEVKVRACADSIVPCTQDFSVNTTATLAASAGSLVSTSVTLVNGVATTKLLYPGAADSTNAVVTLSGEQTVAVNSRKCCSGSSSCTVANSCTTQFKTAGFIFSSNSLTSGDIPTQISGTADNNVYLRAVKTNTTTGACVSRFTTPQNVQLAYQCKNPTTCVAGQTLTLGGTAIQSNANAVAPASIAYTSKAVTFDANGSANIPLNYTDVGQLRLYARLALTATATEPAYTLTGTSNDFVVKPFALAVSSVTTSTNAANPATTNSGAGFISAGSPFKVSVQARNSQSAITPNFGRELSSEKDDITLTANTLVYPTGGTLMALANSGSFAASATAGTYTNSAISWPQVGSITIMPALGDNNYLAAGNIPNFIQSGTVGRFYPDHYQLMAGASTANGCSSFSYMGQPNIALNYSVQAQALDNTVVTNYDAGLPPGTQSQAYAATMAQPIYVAENSDSANGGALNARVGVPGVVWDAGVLTVNSATNGFSSFSRQAAPSAPDGPFASLQLGLNLTDSLDSRALQNLTMNPLTSGTCTTGTCTAASLGSTLSLRYGRLRLDDAFGSASANLPVNFVTEFWTGSFFDQNDADSCTTILRSAITYPNGAISTPANLTIAISGGTTTGVYGSTATNATHIGFTNGSALHSFQKPTASGTGSFVVDVNLAAYPWLSFDWNQNLDYTDDTSLPTARYSFGDYRGHDRLIYWREKF